MGRFSRAVHGAVCCGFLLIGCAPSLPREPSIIPKDPTAGAKCSVAASSLSPLVTEWPATEKGNLEARLREGGIAVEYSGCEMTVLSRCAVAGTYAFTRTTAGTDRVDIADADQLYARLPLGAVSLEADLQRSGRLAVQTTAAGQLTLREAGPGDVSNEGECARATHLVTGVSIGAFKLIAGGAQSVGAGASGFGAAVGGRDQRSESIVREAGDPLACSASTDEAPAPGCSSPLQVFLAPIPGREPPDVSRTARAEERPPDGAVRVRFRAGDEDERWSLLDASGLLCDLPCTRWVGPRSGLTLKLDASRSEDVKTVAVPEDLGYTAGRVLDALVQRQPAYDVSIPVLSGGLLGAAIGGAMIGVAATSDGNPGPEVPNAMGAVFLSAGGALAIVGVALLVAPLRVTEPSLVLSLATDQSARVDLQPGVITVETATTDIVLTPVGAAGTF